MRLADKIAIIVGAVGWLRLPAQPVEILIGAERRLTAKDAQFDIEAFHIAASILDERRQRALAQRHAGAGGVEQAD